MERTRERLDALPVRRLVVLAALLFAAVAAIDAVTGPDVALSYFYVLPLALVTWKLGRNAAYVGSGLAALTWFVIDLSTGAERPLAVPAWNAVIRVAFFLTITVLLSSLKRSLAHEQELSRVDGLTGLLNRRAFDELAERELAKSARTGELLTIAMFDLDDFKRINDAAGHAAGDGALVAVAAAVRSSVRSTDLAGRFGGDEFAVLIAGDQHEAHVVLDRVRARLASTLAAGRPLTCSIGSHTFSGGHLADAMLTADRNLYETKLRGKDGVTSSVGDATDGRQARLVQP